MAKTISIVLLLLMMTPVAADAETIAVCDLVSGVSEAGEEIYRILLDNNYSVAYYDNIPDSTPELMIVFPGIAEYGQGNQLNGGQLTTLSEHMLAGKDLLVFGHRNLPPLWDLLGLEEPALAPEPSDSIWGKEETFLEGLVLKYPEEPEHAAYYISNHDHNHDREVVDANWFSVWAPRGVFFNNDRYGYKALTLNLDLSMVVEETGYNTCSDLVLRCLRDYFGYFPTSIDEEGDVVPEGFRLYQNYPNPFNSRTNIVFYIPSKCEVKIEVFDLMGRRIDELYDGMISEGSHRITWSADDNSSGIYFCRLEVAGRADYKKMILLK